jgi:hypothetical protein
MDDGAACAGGERFAPSSDFDPHAIAAVQGWVTSVRRSGHTWLRWLMASALDREAGGSGELDWRSVYRIMPSDDSYQIWKRYTHVPGFLDPDNRPRLVMSHRRFESFGATAAPVMILVRQPFDQIASNYHHLRASALKPRNEGRPRPDWTPDEFALAPGQGLDYYLSSYRGWALAVARGRASALGYEQLKSDTAGTLLHVFDHFGVPMSEVSVQAAAEYCTISRMAEAERQQHNFILPSWDADPNVRRIRQGQVGRGAALFCAETIDAMHRIISAEPPSMHDMMRATTGWTLAESMARSESVRADTNE